MAPNDFRLVKPGTNGTNGARPDLDARLNGLAEAMAASLNQLQHQIAEQNLRLIYIMNKFRMNKASGLLGLDGKPAIAAITLAQLFEQEREAFEQVLEAQAEQARADVQQKATS